MDGEMEIWKYGKMDNYRNTCTCRYTYTKNINTGIRRDIDGHIHIRVHMYVKIQIHTHTYIHMCTYTNTRIRKRIRIPKFGPPTRDWSLTSMSTPGSRRAAPGCGYQGNEPTEPAGALTGFCPLLIGRKFCHLADPPGLRAPAIGSQFPPSPTAAPPT